MIALGCDHGGYNLKEEVKKYLDETEIKYKDFGTDSPERTDYPVYAEKAVTAVNSGECDCAVLICRTGYGMAMVANKFKGIRCAVCYDEATAKQAKEHSNINVLALPGDYTNISKAVAIIRTWLASEFLGGRYLERLQMIDEIENKNMK